MSEVKVWRTVIVVSTCHVGDTYTALVYKNYVHTAVLTAFVYHKVGKFGQETVRQL